MSPSYQASAGGTGSVHCEHCRNSTSWQIMTYIATINALMHVPYRVRLTEVAPMVPYMLPDMSVNYHAIR